MPQLSADLSTFIRDVPDFPKKGIIFKDITPLLRSPEAFRASIQMLAEPFRDAGITQVVAIESRGFIFGAAVAVELGAGLVPIRKPGKLPWTTRRHEYQLEYGSDILEIHDDAVTANDRVLLVDDVLATGGTAVAACTLLDGLGAEILGAAFLIELGFLSGREKLGARRIHSLLTY
jgi:adenine phosphoribosyltransferase